MSLHNLLTVATGHGVEHYHVASSKDGKLPDAFTWNHVNLAVDQGPDMVAMDCFLAYEADVNINCDFDGSHGAHNDAVKESLKQCGLWRHMISAMAAANVSYGSTMSPARLAQVRECASEYMSMADPKSDSWFQFWLPHMVQQMGAGLSICDEDVADHMWEKLRDAPMYWYKGAKCNLAKYMLCIRRSKEDRKLHAAKACLYGFVVYSHGYKMKVVALHLLPDCSEHCSRYVSPISSDQ